MITEECLKVTQNRISSEQSEQDKMTSVPTSPKEVTKEWLHSCLQENVQDSEAGIEVLDLEQITERNGFMSGYFKAKVKINEQIQKLFIKTILDKEDPLRFMMDKIDFDRIEISTYKSFMPELIKYEQLYCNPERSQLEDLIPSIYAADYCLDKQNRGYYLIMEDISDKYSLIATDEGLSYLQVSKAIEKLARFHAIGNVEYLFTLRSKVALPLFRIRFCQK